MHISWSAALVACQPTTTDRTVSAEAEVPSAQSADLEIARLAFDPAYRVPANFFVDDRASTPGTYTIHHVKDDTGSFEQCSNDMTEAMGWEETDHMQRAVNGPLISAVTQPRYFEFVRELDYGAGSGNAATTSPGFARVFRCDYVVRDGVDRHNRNGFAGNMSARPLTQSAVQEFVEYMWQFAFFWPAEAKVLESTVEAAGPAISSQLELVVRVSQGFDACDRLDLVTWRFEADVDSGTMTKSYIPTRSFEARQVAGTVELCSSN